MAERCAFAIPFVVAVIPLLPAAFWPLTCRDLHDIYLGAATLLPPLGVDAALKLYDL